mmetsp:Transcript_9850/g.29281  ORF Transcript_9850/g.29281 Transcript_9850/m.29281 type:complete len:114 (-) Transcript_9850:111-452(-)
MHGTTFEEPLCPNYWCNTKFSKNWSGPGEDGYVLNPDGTKTVLDLTQIGGPKEVLPAVVRGLNDDECTDNHPSCAQWASWKTNECESNPKFMKVNCPRSCGLCAPLPLGGDEL